MKQIKRSTSIRDYRASSNSYELGGVPMGIPLHIRDIDLEGLTPGQKEMTLKLLTEEADSFAKDDNDVGCIPDLKLDLDLEDQTPVQKNYVAVP